MGGGRQGSGAEGEADLRATAGGTQELEIPAQSPRPLPHDREAMVVIAFRALG